MTSAALDEDMDILELAVDRLRKRVALLGVVMLTMPLGRLTVSFGVSTCRTLAAVDGDDLIREADGML